MEAFNFSLQTMQLMDRYQGLACLSIKSSEPARVDKVMPCIECGLLLFTLTSRCLTYVLHTLHNCVYNETRKSNDRSVVYMSMF